jgi:3-oxoacyl-[acyl-carrier-protein] synthase-3
MTVYTLNQSKFNVGIRSTGVYVGKNIVTNSDLEKISDTTDEWIYSHTGIRERRIAEKNVSTSDMLFEAGKMAMERGNIRPEQIDLLIVATLSPDHRDPATSALLQAKLGLKNAFSFDMNTGGCPASVYALIVGSQFISNGQCRHVLVLMGDVISKLINWHDRTSNYFFGDAAGAYLLGPVKIGKGIISYHLGTDGTGYESIMIPAGGSRAPITQELIEKNQNCVRIDGKKVKEFAVPALCRAVNEVMTASALKPAEIDWIFPHQANFRLIEAAFDKLNFPLEKTCTNIEKYGNTGGASVPLVLHEAILSHKVKPGQKIILVSFGAGFQWGSACLNWCAEEDFI